MSRLAAVKAGHQQMTIDEYLNLDRDETPQAGMTAGDIGVDPNPIGTELVTVGDVSHPKKGTGPHDGDCPHSQQCELERQQLPYYLPPRCHWRAWGDWERCPIYRNGGNGP